MKKFIFITLFSLINLHGADYSNSDVYLCNSRNSKKYHLRKKCRGLSNCKHEIIKVDLKKAKEMGKTLCGWE